MNDANRESIFKMLAEGTLNPEEAAKLLARLSEEEQSTKAGQSNTGTSQTSTKGSKSDRDKRDRDRAESDKAPTEKVAITGADGKEKVIEVPSGLVPMITKIIAEQVKEQTIKVARETATGAKNLILNKFDEVRDTIKTAVSGGNKKPVVLPTPPPTPEETKRATARRQILAMVQAGTITAVDAGRLIRELDALQEFENAQSGPKDDDDDSSATRSKNRR